MNRTEIQRLKSSLRIEEVVARYLPLTRHGRGYTGLCPFHTDHHPSLEVSPDRQTFTCFACGERGDVFAFIEKIEHCTFQEAIAKCRPSASCRAEQKKPEPLSPPPAAPSRDNQRFLQSLLPYASGCQELSGAYLDFEVGQSPVQTPKEWQAMRNRIVFPIRDEAGSLVGFAARRLNDTDTTAPKYINSSAHDGYRKGETLYGLHRAQAALQKTGVLFLTEGYKDTIAMHAAGFTNTVALSGTALTPAHIALIKTRAQRVYLLLDGDEAGRTAARKAFSQLMAARIETENIALSEGEDPDSLFRKWGRKAFIARLHQLTNRPHTSESGLLTACLLYPETEHAFKGRSIRFVDMLYHILPVDGLEFENEAYLQILRHLSQGGTEATLPPSLRIVADELHLEFAPQLHRDLEQLAAMLPEANNRIVIYLSRLFFLYTEVRLLRQIRREVQRLLATPPGDIRRRTDLLIYIAGRRELLRHVSECMERPGKVDMIPPA